MCLHIHAAVIAVSLSLGAAPLAAQGLGEMARKAEESRKAAKKGAKVYTNADAGNVQAATITSPTASQGGAATTPASGEGAKSGEQPAADARTGQKDQAYWADRMKGLQAQLERDTQFAAAIQTRVNILSADLVNNDQGQRPAIEADRSRAVAELARLQKTIDDDKKAIADLEDEARRAGVPPGWLR
jgi:hypothetical protein